jgi:hypothetical protein
MYSRPDLHLLSRRGILVPLHHVLAAHAQVQMRRRGRVPGRCYSDQYGARFSGLYVAYVRRVQTAIAMAAKVGDGGRVSLGLCVSVWCIGIMVATR